MFTLIFCALFLLGVWLICSRNIISNVIGWLSFISAVFITALRFEYKVAAAALGVLGVVFFVVLIVETIEAINKKAVN